MSAQQTKKLLTREQFLNLAIEVTDWMIEHEDGLERDDFVRLLDHIQAANVYAKPEPTPTEIAERLARAQGWVMTDWSGGWAWYEHNGPRRDYRVAIGSRGERENSPPKLTSQQAAHWILTRLLELEYMEES